MDLSPAFLTQLKHEASSQCQIYMADIDDMCLCTLLQEELIRTSARMRAYTLLAYHSRYVMV